VAEMLGRIDKSNEAHVKARLITSKISYAGIAAIIINYLVYFIYWCCYRTDGQILNGKIEKWTMGYLPCTFLLIDCLLLFIGLVWI
jgi:hypothetical protein